MRRLLILAGLLCCGPPQAGADVTQPCVGTAAEANNASIAPALPSCVQAADVMVATVWARGNGTIGDPAGWTISKETQLRPSANTHKVQIAWRAWQAGDSAPTWTYTGGAAGQNVVGYIFVLRGADTADPLAVFSADSTNASAANIGPITGFTPTAAGNNGAVLVFGHKVDIWTSVDDLTQSGLTFIEVGEAQGTLGNGHAFVVSFAAYTGTPPTVTDKTFTVTGGASASGSGFMIGVKPPAGGGAAGGGVSFLGGGTLQGGGRGGGLGTAADTTAPTLANVLASAVIHNSADIQWNSSECADSQVEYGLTTGYGSSTTLDTACVFNHKQVLSGLAAGTLYHFRVKSRDAAGNLATSGDFTFTTQAQPDVTPPVISNVQVTSITTSGATVSWMTNEPADCAVNYGLTTSLGTLVSSATLTTSCSIALTGLAEGVTYHYVARSADASGNIAATTDATFDTLTPPPNDTTAPMISGISPGTPLATAATIVWTTDEAADREVEYGLTTGYGSTSGVLTPAATSHSVQLTGLTPSTLYNYRVKSRDNSGNLATSTNNTFNTAAGSATTGIWTSAAELASKPMSGTAWTNVKSAADAACGTPSLSNQDDASNVCVLAKAIVFARTGTESYRTGVKAAITSIVNNGTYSGRALALGRELAAYAIAADLIQLATNDPDLDTQWRAKLAELRDTATNSGPTNLKDCHEDRPNNWGTHCGATLAAIARYLNDQTRLDRVAQVFKGWLGDRTSYTGFTYASPFSWHCNPSCAASDQACHDAVTSRRGINPQFCSREIDGVPRILGGVLPDDQRRLGGSPGNYPIPTDCGANCGYVWEALQGALVQAYILHRAGYPTFTWENGAICRAYAFLHTGANFVGGTPFVAASDDTWQPSLYNNAALCNRSDPAPVPSNPGKNVGWTDWSHQ